MAIQAGRHQFGTDRGRIVLTTFRDGLAAQAGHDLTIEVAVWSGEIEIADDLKPVALQVRIDLSSLVVKEGSGGLKPLTDRDKREIAATSRKVLSAAGGLEASYAASGFEPADSGDGGVVAGTLTIGGNSGPLQLRVSQTGPGAYKATGTVRQTSFGIKPYTGFLGALKVRDTVDFEAQVQLPDDAGGAAG
jgi:polyisoprenoid-binding protein YceI